MGKSKRDITSTREARKNAARNILDIRKRKNERMAREEIEAQENDQGVEIVDEERDSRRRLFENEMLERIDAREQVARRERNEREGIEAQENDQGVEIIDDERDSRRRLYAHEMQERIGARERTSRREHREQENQRTIEDRTAIETEESRQKHQHDRFLATMNSFTKISQAQERKQYLQNNLQILNDAAAHHAALARERNELANRLDGLPIWSRERKKDSPEMIQLANLESKITESQAHLTAAARANNEFGDTAWASAKVSSDVILPDGTIEVASDKLLQQNKVGKEDSSPGVDHELTLSTGRKISQHYHLNPILAKSRSGENTPARTLTTTVITDGGKKAHYNIDFVTGLGQWDVNSGLTADEIGEIEFKAKITARNIGFDLNRLR